jgi:hypothetical protein
VHSFGSRRMNRRTLLLLPLLATGCASTAGGRPFSGVLAPPVGKAAVYVYRPRAIAGNWVAQSVQVAGQAEATLPLDSFRRFLVEPGRVEVSNVATYGRLPFSLAFDVEQNSVVFVRFTFSHTPFPGGRKGNLRDDPWMGFQLVPSEEAQRELPRMSEPT